MTEWMIRGVEYANCPCDYGCPCQFNAPTSHGNCEGVVSGHIEEGYHGDTRLDGLDWALTFWYPGEVAEGNGRAQFIIDEGADDAQREALGRILHGEDTAPGATIFNVLSATFSEMLETLYLPVELEIDVDARMGRLSIPGVVESTGSPMIDPFSGEPSRARINLPNGFEYTVAEVGSGSSKLTGAIALELTDSYGQFNILHMNQDEVIR